MLLMTAANKVTSIRFLLCIVYYVVLTLCLKQRDQGLLAMAFILNQIIAWSDLLDGYLARKYKEVTHFGRIADPLVDKILVCGSFIFFLALDPLTRIFTPWFATAVLGPEFLVSRIRGAMEAAGIPFPATFWGKAKTAIQNVACGTALGYAAWFPTARWTELLTISLMWATLVATVMSGVTYVLSARKFLGSERV
jgi:CDP-diacylglycerol--glycerol-3-phosphate 3-phosphatidyltransferase